MAELNRLVDIPLAGGENNQGVQEFLWMIEKEFYDILQPEVLVTEGIQGLRAVAALGLAHHKLVVPHHGRGQLGTRVGNTPEPGIDRDCLGRVSSKSCHSRQWADCSEGWS